LKSIEQTILSNSAKRERTIAHIVDAITIDGGQMADVLVSANTETLFVASLVADRLQKPLAYVRSEPKKHGLGKQVEGSINHGDRAVVLSLVTDHDLTRNIEASVAALRAAGAIVAYCLSIEGAFPEMVTGFLSEQGIPYGDTGSAAPADWQTPLKRRVADALLDVRAVVINSQNPFRYASGLLSPIYTDCRLLMSNPTQWRVITDAFVDVIHHDVDLGTVDTLGGTATSGIPHASLISDRLKLPLVYVTFEDTKEGDIKGNFTSGSNIVMIEDHISTGSSVLSSAAVLRREGAKVDWCFAIFTYGYPAALANFQEKGIRFETLSDLETLLSVAIQRGYINEDQRREVLEWRRDPKEWTRREEERQRSVHAG
jgi:orotate phosphoribosyltransferase